ncbi:MAG: hypothetical protein ABSG96_11340 [Terracidiphilus sp.]
MLPRRDDTGLLAVVYSAMVLKRILHSALFLCILSASCCAQFKDPGADTRKVAAESAWLTLTPEQKSQTLEFAEPFKDYMRHAKSASLSEAELIRLARVDAQAKPATALDVRNALAMLKCSPPTLTTV